MKYKEERLNFILFSLGKTLSVFGTSIYTFAIGLYVLEITGSGLNFALNLVMNIIPMLLINPFAGVIADKLDKKKLVVLMDLLNGIFFLILFFVSGVYGFELPMIYLSTLITTIFTTIFGVTMESAIPNIVSENKLMNINSVSKIIDSISSIIGPMVGGIVFAFLDIRLFILINGASFIFSGILEMFIDFQYKHYDEEKEKVKSNFSIEIKEGFRYLREREDIKSSFGVLTLLNFFIGFSATVPLPYIINNILSLGSESLGIIQSAFPLGMILGATMIKSIFEKIPYKKVLQYSNIVISMCIVMLGVPIIFGNIIFEPKVYLIYYFVVMIFFGISISFIDIPIIYLMQKLVSDEYRGRVFSIGKSMVQAILPIGLILSGYLISKIPVYIITIIGGIFLMLGNLILIHKNTIKG
ncbi:Permease [[Clostridium] ultunense Esp]|nr:Permease [[Clostridium] ultunense Esp]